MSIYIFLKITASSISIKLLLKVSFLKLPAQSIFFWRKYLQRAFSAHFNSVTNCSIDGPFDRLKPPGAAGI